MNGTRLLTSTNTIAITLSLTVLAALVAALPVRADLLPIYGGPTYDSSTQTGYHGGSAARVNDTGTAVGYAEKYDAGSDMGRRAFRWDVTGATELDNLGTDASGYTNAEANAVNATGTTVGYANFYDADIDYGTRAVRWDAGGTTATPLGVLGSSNAGYTNVAALAINASGTIVGYASKYDGGTYKGIRAVRWDFSGAPSPELGSLGTDGSGVTSAEAYAVNASDTAVGYANKYDDGGVNKGYRAVRWDAGGTDATELDNLGTDGSDDTQARAYAINDTGTAVGYAIKYDGGTNKGTRAVRWNAGGTTATELGNLGTDASGVTYAYVNAINATGTVVGWARKYTGAGANLGDRAVYWGADGVAVDLNTLIDPTSGWVLTEACAISDTGWISGIGQFDPDGAGGLDAYDRLFLVQIPEPATFGLLALGGLAVLRRRRQ